MRRFTDAKAHLTVLTAEAPDDGELYHLLGVCELSVGKTDEAEKALKKAIASPPTQVESYVLLAAMLWRTRSDTTRADKYMQDMIKEKKSVPAYLARAAYFRDRRKAEAAADKQEYYMKMAGEDIAAARQLAPDDLNVLLESAEWWLSQTKPRAENENKPLFDNARADVKHALELHSKEPRLYLLRSRLENLAGQPKEATASLRRSLKEVPAENQAEILFTLADLLIDQGLLSEARALLTRLREMGVASTLVSYLEARVLVKKGDQWVEAARALEALRPLLIDHPQLGMRAELLLGQSYEQLGDPDQQYAAFRRALSSDPLSLPAVNGMAQALVAMGKLSDAIGEFRRLVPRVPEAKFTVRALSNPTQSRSTEK